MTPFVIGTRQDVVAFALAGVAGVVCTTPDDVSRALSQLTSDQIALISGGLASEQIADWEKSGRGPMFVVLPQR